MKVTVEDFVANQSLSDRSRAAYLADLRRFEAWFASRSAGLSELTRGDIFEYRQHQLDKGLAESTVNRYLWTLNRYFDWLVEQGAINKSPMSRLLFSRPGVRVRETLTLDQLRAMWSSAIEPRDRVVIALLGINALRSDEVARAEVSDLSQQDGCRILRLPGRRGTRTYPLTVLAPEVDAAIGEHLDGRRTGALVSPGPGGRLNRAKILRIVARVAKAAELPFHVTPSTLSTTMRSLAIEHGFSYVGVVRATGESEARRLAKAVGQATNPISHHASLRLARLVVGTGSSTMDLLHRAEIVLDETDLPPAAAAGVAGAALERHLRLLARQRGVRVNEDKAALGAYAGQLIKARVIEPAEYDRINAIARHRTNGAHGWFDKVSMAEAQWVIRECLDLASRYTLAETVDEPVLLGGAS